MERGLLWLPLLVIFIWLAWAGWNEYQKVEAYRIWAKQFQRSKYDIYAVLGQAGREITWGKPTRKGPINLQTFTLDDVQSIKLLIDGQPVNLQSPPNRGGAAALEFSFFSPTAPVRIPFTEVALAVEWGKQLQQELQVLRINQES
ncbi:MAG: hypothetical protein N3E45_09880 [Oscillatoriaceae bacterium SKW80]|nr:hypothetical protein [Oscillatoriaceae bacterium SKYG93]MCX8121124.1 hypothetical protein [Oscillatoriaceae bacterium SKW80]MDW8453546.1 hypothetical protein [Oscillatoriaceae cyanobacterium SKYGB_i_bin93]HIK26897.1 hypothetical protein [Oscillatoriaceae cyanobacterium M7585_C2015_266]